LALAVAGNGGCGGCGCIIQKQTWQRAKWGTPHAHAAARQRGAPASGVSTRVAASEAAGTTPGGRRGAGRLAHAGHAAGGGDHGKRSAGYLASIEALSDWR